MTELRNVYYGKSLKDISIKINEKEIVTIIGPNGGGKTSLLKIIAGIKKSCSGKVIRDKSLKIGYMPQKVNFNPTLPINVKCFLELDNKVDKNYLKQKIEELEIKDLLFKQLHCLSGGEVQKVLFTSAIASKPDMLVLDEPANHLEISARKKLYRIIAEQKKSRSVVIASHDVHVVMKQTDKVICINRSVCCMGCPKQVTASKDFANMFGSDLSFYKHNHADF